MNNKVKILGLTLLFAAMGSEALTLGGVRGAAWIGQPLDVLIPVQLDVGNDASSQCFETDVFHADVRQDASRVRVTVEKTTQPQSVDVRVRSSALVNEPVVTLNFRVGCGQKTSRRYVLLADIPRETTPPLAVASTVLPRLAPVRAELGAVDSAPVAKVRRVRVAKAPLMKPAAAKTPKAAPLTKKKPEAPSDQAQLKLDPLGLQSDRTANTEAPISAEEVQRKQQQMLALEQALKDGQLLAAKNQASLTDLKARLQQAESDRVPASVLYGLVALVLASFAAVVFLWIRQRRQAAISDDWWFDKVETQMQADAVDGPLMAAAVSTPKGAPDKHRVTPTMPESPPDLGHSPGNELDVDQVEMGDSAFDHFRIGQADAPSPSLPESQLNTAAPPLRAGGSFSSGAVQDLRQQAEFFVSLGEGERAIRLLKRQIDESEVPNPFYYLDLLEILQTHHLKNEFQHWSEKFQQIFTGRVPEFSAFKREGRNLESYPEVLTSLSALWGTPAAQAEIETRLFQAPGVSSAQTFDLAAYRDLLLLHAVAQSGASDLVAEGGAPALQAMAHAPLQVPEFEADPLPALPTSPGEPAPVVLDLDLGLNFDEQTPSENAPSPDAGLDFELPGLMDFDMPQAEVEPPQEHENLIDFQITKPPPSA